MWQSQIDHTGDHRPWLHAAWAHPPLTVTIQWHITLRWQKECAGWTLVTGMSPTVPKAGESPWNYLEKWGHTIILLVIASTKGKMGSIILIQHLRPGMFWLPNYIFIALEVLGFPSVWWYFCFFSPPTPDLPMEVNNMVELQIHLLLDLEQDNPFLTHTKEAFDKPHQEETQAFCTKPWPSLVLHLMGLICSALLGLFLGSLGRAQCLP